MKFPISILTLVLPLILAACGPVTPVPAAAPAAAAQPVTPLPIASWPGLKDGWSVFRSNPDVYAAAYDAGGYLWATAAGRVLRWRIDSGEFTAFDSSDGLPVGPGNLTVFGDQIWVTGSGGATAVYSLGKWTTHESGADSAYSFFVALDQLWLTTSEGLYRLAGGEWQAFDRIPEVYTRGQTYYSVAASSDGSLWFSGGDRVLRFDGVTWREYENLRGVQRSVNLSDGTLLFIFDDVILRFDGSAIHPVVLPGEQYHYSIRSALLTPAGDLWLQTYGSYAEALEQGNPTYVIHNGQAALAPPVLFKDPPDDSLYTPAVMTPQGWVFDGRDALFLYDGLAWRKFSMEAPEPIARLLSATLIGFEPDGTLWAARGGKTPIRYDGRRVDFVIDGDSCATRYQSKWLLDPHGTLIGGDYGGKVLCLYETNTGRSRSVELFFDISDFSVSPQGEIWVALRAGFIAQLTPAFLQSGDFSDLDLIKVGEGLARRPVNPSRIESGADGSVWVFAQGIGLYRYRDGGWSYAGLHTLKDSSAFAVDAQGRVWAGECGKLHMYDGKQWTTFTQKCINPARITVAPDGVVWFIDVCDGVYRFDGGQWTHYTDADLGGFHPYRILSAPDGALWFVGYQAAARYKP